jgi:S1-C subfamily serine protease
MKNVVITAVITAVLVFAVALGVCNWAAGRANEVFDAKDAEIEVWKRQYTELSHVIQMNQKDAKLFTDDWNAQVKRLSDEKAVLKSEIAEWEVCAAKRNAEPNLPDPTPTFAVEPNFTDQVQESIKGVVHLQAPRWQGSGFVVGPRHIVTAWHCADDIEEFLITTHNGHQVRATRAYSNKDNDVAHIWVDDLTCIAEERGTLAHEVVLSPLPLGSIEDVRLGQSVYSIGSTFGKVHFNAVATGIIQTLDLDLENFGLPPNYRWVTLFSNTAEGAGGNSGGPLFTLDGKVIGVWVGSMGNTVHYCIPVDVFMKDISLIATLFTQDRYEREEAIEQGYGFSEYKPEWYNLWGLFHRGN